MKLLRLRQENQYAFSFKVLEYLSEVAISQSITSDEPFNSWLIEKHLMKSVSQLDVRVPLCTKHYIANIYLECSFTDFVNDVSFFAREQTQKDGKIKYYADKL